MEEAEDIDESLIASQFLEKALESAKKSGYREGVDDGSNFAFQKGFDTGYETAFKASLALGIYKALATSLPKEVKIAPEIEEILKEGRKGACVLCKTEPEIVTTRKKEEKSLEEVVKAQQDHSVHTIRTLYEYYQPLFEKYDLDVENLPHPDKDL